MKIEDCNGRELKPGVAVAYNQSGNIMPGKIEKIIHRWKTVTWHPGKQWVGSFRIRNMITNAESVVKRPESMMAIPEVFP